MRKEIIIACLKGLNTGVLSYPGLFVELIGFVKSEYSRVDLHQSPDVDSTLITALEKVGTQIFTKELDAKSRAQLIQQLTRLQESSGPDWQRRARKYIKGWVQYLTSSAAFEDFMNSRVNERTTTGTGLTLDKLDELETFKTMEFEASFLAQETFKSSICIEVIKGPHKGEKFTFQERQVIFVGRLAKEQDNQTRISLFKDLQVSQNHCLLEFAASKCIVRDLSENGTLLNNIRLDEESKLASGSRISLGSSELLIRLDDGLGLSDTARLDIDESSSLDSRQPGSLSVDETVRLNIGESSSLDSRQPGLNVDETVKLAPESFNFGTIKAKAPETDKVISLTPSAGIPILQVPAEFLNTGEASSLGPPGTQELLRPEAKPLGVPQGLSEEEAELFPNESLPGIEILSLLDQGSVGEIYLARHLKNGELVVIKTMVPESTPDNSVINNFLREAKRVSGFRHPHAVRIYDGGYANDIFYFVMEYIKGQDADTMIKDRGRPFSLRSGLSIIRQILSVLSAAHSGGFVHRNIKSRNIIIKQYPTGKRVAKLTDFGLARTFEELGLNFISQIGSGEISPAFMAPEQINDSKKAGPAADIYSIGASLHFLLSGKMAINLDQSSHFSLAVLEQSPTPLRQHLPKAPRVLENLILRCLAKDPKDRFTDVDELDKTLKDILQR
jgi:pSer/pThr/pTyr-binding forkhead associated (FHA) protein